jgi:hypothetical protein
MRDELSTSVRTKDAIIDFKHYQSAHCENGVASSLLKHHGIHLSEPMVFGIGSGYFFSYMPFIKLNYLPVISFRPLPGMIFKRITKRLGIKIKREKFSDPLKSMERLDETLKSGIPAGCLVGVYHLPYFPAPYRFHFNAHNLIVYGKQNGSYLISDPVMETPVMLTKEEFMRVRFAKGTYPPRGRMYYIEGLPGNFDLKHAIIKGIHQTCKDMLEIPVPLFGVKGIRYLSKRMKRWPEKLGKKKASQYLGQVVRMLEEIGTGGAGFRFIYAAFLQEASKILDRKELMEISKQMTEAGDRWREFAVISGRIIKERAGSEESYESAANILMDIADREEKIFMTLKNHFK